MRDLNGRNPTTPLANRRARALRGNLSLPERILWQRLRDGRLTGLRFRRQHPLLDYILDFYCAERRLAVEVDGGDHGQPDRRAHDRRRDARLVKVGVLTLRFWASSILGNETLDGVLATIAETALTRPVFPPLARRAGSPPPVNGERA